MKLTVEVSSDAEAILERLGKLVGYNTAQETLGYLVMLVSDGWRRPGSWERGWLGHAFPLDRMEDER